MAIGLEVADLVVTVPSGGTIALPSLRLGDGEAAVLFGPSGAGKSTLLAAVCGTLHRPGFVARGRVCWRGRECGAWSPAERRDWLWRDVAFLPQDAHSALDPLAPIGAQLAAATGRPPAELTAMMQQLGVAEASTLLARLPHAISGGQAQRVLLAIAFLRGPALVVADEPSASLDAHSYGELVAHLRSLLSKGAAGLLATHDPRLAADLGARIYRCRDGVFAEAPLPESPWPERLAAPPGEAVVLAASGVTVAYAGRAVLDGVDFACRRGEVVAIVGPSGVGKTSLLRVLAGRRDVDRGEVRRPARRAAVQLVDQDAFASLTPGRALGELLAEAQAPGFDALATAAALHLAPAVLGKSRVQMSVGERRRAALLRALAVLPDVLLLDEPTEGLDRAAATSLLRAVMERQRALGLAIVVVTHDAALARAMAHRVLELREGKLCTS